MPKKKSEDGGILKYFKTSTSAGHRVASAPRPCIVEAATDTEINAGASTISENDSDRQMGTGISAPTDSTPQVSLNVNVENTPNQHNDVQNNETLNIIPLNDIHNYINKNTDNSLKLDILRNLWQPGELYIFPKTGERNLKFQRRWLVLWTWLAYSKAEDGAFCKYCVLFGSALTGKGTHQAPGQLCQSKLNNWKKAIEKFNEHQSTQYHQESMSKYCSIKSHEEHATKPIDLQLSSQKETEEAEHRLRMKAVIESVVFCGRQGIALRGHRDSGPLTVEEPDTNEGNFRAVLRLQARGNEEYAKLMESAPKNATYLSPTIQNEVIETINDMMLREIVDKINRSPCFAFLADETRACDNTEKCVICARFYDVDDKLMCEYFLQYETVEDLTGRGLAWTFLSSLERYGLDMEKLRAQGFDGAAVMSGMMNGVQAVVKEKAPTAIYVHCCAHNLNLGICTACGVAPIRNTMGTLEHLHTFFNTPQRQLELTSAIERVSPDASHKKLKHLCATRWVERHDAVDSFCELREATTVALQEIKFWKDRKTSSQADNLLLAISRPEFILSLFAIKQVFAYSLPLCKYLQKEQIDLAAAVDHASLVVAELRNMLVNSECEFQKLFQQASVIAEKNDFTMSRPRNRQAARSNEAPISDEQYWRDLIYVPFLQSFIDSLEQRFLKYKDILRSFMCLLPVDPSATPSEEQKSRLETLCLFYKNDIKSSLDHVHAELRLWYRCLAQNKFTSRAALDALQLCDVELFPNVFTLLVILATLPVSTAKAERLFSTLKLIKTYLRNCTGDVRLNGLAMMYVYRKRIPSVERILEEFCKKKRRNKS